MEKIKQHKVTIGVDQLLSNSGIVEHRCLENITNLYKCSGKYNNQQYCKAIIETSMVSNTEGLTDNSQSFGVILMNMKNPSTRNSLSSFSELLDVKKLFPHIGGC